MTKLELSRLARVTLALATLVPVARAEGPSPAAPAAPSAPVIPTTPSEPPPTARFAPNGPGSGPGAPESSDVSDARAAFRLGSALAKQGQWLDALAAFERSERMRAHPITTYNVAYCERALGHYARAYKTFSAALEPAATPDEPTLSPDLEAQARDYLVETEQRVARISVAFAAPNLSMRVDGHPLEPLRGTGDRTVLIVAANDAPEVQSAPATFDLWLDPGTHVFVVAVPGRENLVESHIFDAGSSAALTFPTQPVAPPTATTLPSSPTPSSGSIDSAPVSHGPNRVPAIVAFSIGGAALVTSGVFGALSLHEKGSLKCSGPTGYSCPPEDADQIDRMKRFAAFATAGLVVGGVGAALGTYLWFSANGASEKPSDPKTAVTVRPWVGIGSAGVAGKF